MLVAVALMAVGLGGCALREPLPPQAPLEVSGEGAYKLQPGETLKITVYGDEQVSGEYTIDGQGQINLPLLGGIAAAGQTPASLQAQTTEALRAAGLYEDPRVSIEVKALRPIYIIGEVQNPGSYPYQPHMDVFQAIALAGGYAPRADKDRIILTRGTDGQKARMSAKENTPVLPGDSLMVDQRLF